MTPPTRAEMDLDWFFNAGASLMGLHAQAYDPDGGGGVWDSERIESTHLAFRDPRHRAAVDRYRGLEPRVAALGPEARAIVYARFQPYPWAGALRAVAGPLSGVTLLTVAAVAAYGRKHAGRRAGVADLRDWLALEATAPQRLATFRPIVAEARRLVVVALASWDSVK